MELLLTGPVLCRVQVTDKDIDSLNILRIYYCRDRHEIAETERVMREKLALIQTRQAVEDIWVRELLEEMELEKLRRNPAIIFAQTVANRPVRRKR